MPINPANIFPAVLKAKEVATEAYVDNEVANVSFTYPELADKDTLAVELGYVNYAALQAAAVGGSTIINGGYINTDLVEANGITADKLFAGELITNTAQIKDAIITNAKIDDASITTAKIVDASVDTLQIKDSAVIVTVAQSGTNTVSIPVNTWSTAATSVVDCSDFTANSHLVLIFHCFCQCTSVTGGSTATATVNIRIIEDDTTVIYSKSQESSNAGGVTAVINELQATTRVPSAQSHTYKLQVRPTVQAGTFSQAKYYERHLIVQGAKR